MYVKPGAKSVRARLADGERLIGTWVCMRSHAAIELLAELPFDFVVLDLQHGELSPVSYTHLPLPRSNRS